MVICVYCGAEITDMHLKRHYESVKCKRFQKKLLKENTKIKPKYPSERKPRISKKIENTVADSDIKYNLLQSENKSLQKEMEWKINILQEQITELKAENKLQKNIVRQHINELKSENKLPKKHTRKQIPKAVRESVFTLYEKECNGKCWCCNIETITHANFRCGHIIADREGGLSTIENLRPICPSCNLSMGTQNMISFKQEYGMTAHLPIITLDKEDITKEKA